MLDFFNLFNNIFCAADFLTFVIYLTTYFCYLFNNIFCADSFFIFGYSCIQHCTSHSWLGCFSKKNRSHNINTYTYLTLECDTLLNLFDVAFKQPHLNYNAVQGDFQFFIAYLLLVLIFIIVVGKWINKHPDGTAWHQSFLEPGKHRTRTEDHEVKFLLCQYFSKYGIMYVH